MIDKEVYIMEEKLRKNYVSMMEALHKRVSDTHEMYLKYKTGQITEDEAIEYFNVKYES